MGGKPRRRSHPGIFFVIGKKDAENFARELARQGLHVEPNEAWGYNQVWSFTDKAHEHYLVCGARGWLWMARAQSNY